MTMVKQVDVCCDSCGEWLVALADTIKQAEEVAREALWVRQDDRDLCTRCQPDHVYTKNIERALGLRR